MMSTLVSPACWRCRIASSVTRRFDKRSYEDRLFVDLNTEDETGLPWTYLDQAPDPTVIVPGRVVVVGAGSAIPIAEVVDVAVDGLVHVRPLPGPVTEERLKSASLRV